MISMTLGEKNKTTHPLDNQYWSKREYWRWWGYSCPNDPRIVVSKHPRWAGYTVNFAHKRAIPILAVIATGLSIPPVAVLVLMPGQVFPIIAVSTLSILIMLAYCYKAANPKTWKGKESPNN